MQTYTVNMSWGKVPARHITITVYIPQIIQAHMLSSVLLVPFYQKSRIEAG